MKIKICGMKHPDNIREIAALAPDMMGFIFYAQSPRYVSVGEVAAALPLLTKTIQRVGVFVNELPEKVIEICTRLQLNYAQLHGNETPQIAAQIRNKGIGVIKAFKVDDAFNMNTVLDYEESADFFLFDTNTAQHGGSGKKFNWSILNTYPSNKPFILSGGIGVDDIEEVLNLTFPHFYGIDINSKIELSPGLKDVQQAQNIITKIRIEQ